MERMTGIEPTLSAWETEVPRHGDSAVTWGNVLLAGSRAVGALPTVAGADPCCPLGEARVRHDVQRWRAMAADRWNLSASIDIGRCGRLAVPIGLEGASPWIVVSQSVEATSSADVSQSVRAASSSRAASLGCFGLRDAQ